MSVKTPNFIIILYYARVAILVFIQYIEEDQLLFLDFHRGGLSVVIDFQSFYQPPREWH